MRYSVMESLLDDIECMIKINEPFFSVAKMYCHKPTVGAKLRFETIDDESKLKCFVDVYIGNKRIQTTEQILEKRLFCKTARQVKLRMKHFVIINTDHIFALTPLEILHENSPLIIRNRYKEF